MNYITTVYLFDKVQSLQIMIGFKSSLDFPFIDEKVRDLFSSYDIQKNGVIDADEMKGKNGIDTVLIPY